MKAEWKAAKQKKCCNIPNKHTEVSKTFFFLTKYISNWAFLYWTRKKLKQTPQKNYNENLPKNVVFPSLSNFIWRNGGKKIHRTAIKQEINF